MIGLISESVKGYIANTETKITKGIKESSGIMNLLLCFYLRYFLMNLYLFTIGKSVWICEKNNMTRLC